MIDALQLRHEIIRPTLKHLDSVIPYSMAAENLLMGTCAQESDMGLYVVQRENGPARGIFQMEPATEEDIALNYMSYRSDLSREVNQLVPEFTHGGINDLTGNLFYAAAMCRVHYWRVPMAMPEEDNVAAMANYWKLFYNTPEGKGTEAEFIHNYNRYVA